MPRRLRDVPLDAALAVGFAAAAQVELWLDPPQAHNPRGPLALLALALAGTLLLRRRAPLVALTLGGALFVGVDVLTTGLNDDPMFLALMLLVLVYSAGAYTEGLTAVAAGVAVAALTTAAVLQDGGSVNIGGFLFFGLIFGGPWLAGVAIRRRRGRERQLLVEQREHARAAVAEERTRIARELHDVVAHAISVIVLQARGARHELEADGDGARDAIDAIERTAAQALAEMRRLLAMLREDDESVPLAPQPSLADVGALAAQVRAAGLPVDVRVEGEPRELPPGVNLSAYRVVQEALTNSLKHAGQARARVVLRYAPSALEIEVTDDGAGASDNGRGGGAGLAGMRERVAVFGGQVDAGPRPDGGYRVRARLPL